MGKEWGNLFLPEVGDEVLVGFEFGDTTPAVRDRRAVERQVVASAAVQRREVDAACPAQVVKRGIVSRIGNQLTFEDEIPSPLTPKPATKGKITLGDADAKVAADVRRASTASCTSSATAAR